MRSLRRGCGRRACRRRCVMCRSTVRRLRKSCADISRLLLPTASRPRISASRLLKPAGEPPSVRKAFTASMIGSIFSQGTVATARRRAFGIMAAKSRLLAKGGGSRPLCRCMTRVGAVTLGRKGGSRRGWRRRPSIARPSRRRSLRCMTEPATVSVLRGPPGSSCWPSSRRRRASCRASVELDRGRLCKRWPL